MSVGRWVDTAIECALVQGAKVAHRVLQTIPSAAERRAPSLSDVGYQLLAGPPSDWVGFYDCPCGGAYEIFDDSTSDDVARLQKWFDEHRRCSVLNAMSSEAAQDGYYDLVNDFVDTRLVEPEARTYTIADVHNMRWRPVQPESGLYPSGQPTDDIRAEDFGEHPDLDPQAVIGKRPDWAGIGVPPADGSVVNVVEAVAKVLFIEVTSPVGRPGRQFWEQLDPDAQAPWLGFAVALCKHFNVTPK